MIPNKNGALTVLGSKGSIIKITTNPAIRARRNLKTSESFTVALKAKCQINPILGNHSALGPSTLAITIIASHGLELRYGQRLTFSIKAKLKKFSARVNIICTVA
jgi:hypothetical protein